MRSSLATVDSAISAVPRERSTNDWYVEPEWAIDGLLDVQRFAGSVWDPACGAGTICKVFARHGFEAVGSDIEDRGFGGVQDFLDKNFSFVNVDNIVTNPPFSLAEVFLARALSVARLKVAMLLRLSWAEGRGRRWVWDTTPLAAVHPFAARVSMPPGGVKVEAKGGAVAFAWFVWDHGWPVGMPPIVRRIERGAA
jgi:hypothetical protein